MSTSMDCGRRKENELASLGPKHEKRGTREADYNWRAGNGKTTRLNRTGSVVKAHSIACATSTYSMKTAYLSGQSLGNPQLTLSIPFKKKTATQMHAACAKYVARHKLGMGLQNPVRFASSRSA